jgi:hypothetical protein
MTPPYQGTYNLPSIARGAVWAFVLLLSSGCATTTGGGGAQWWNPLTWGSAREAQQVDRAEAALMQASAAEGHARTDLLRSAQRAAHEASLALLSAPASRPVEVATEAAQATTASLDQALGALPATTLAAVRAQVAGLLSDNSTLRAEAEAARAAARESDASASRALAEATRRTAAAEAVADTARQDLRDAFARENALANQLRRQQWIAGLSTAATLLASLAALAYRANAFGLADGVARALADLRRSQPATAALATSALDAGLNRAEQSTISRLVHRHLAP